jgi:hypothetical protein
MLFHSLSVFYRLNATCLNQFDHNPVQLLAVQVSFPGNMDDKGGY